MKSEFATVVRVNANIEAILARLPALALDDCWLVSGARFQTVWNIRTRRAATYGIKDYDLFYFDDDTSWEAENDAIRRASRLFADLDADIQIRNQARVHLWYEEKFAAPYPPLRSAKEGIDRFLMQNAQIGMRPYDGQYEIYAPRGLGDVEAMIVRPNITANFRDALYFEKANRWKALWPEITILPVS